MYKQICYLINNLFIVNVVVFSVRITLCVYIILGPSSCSIHPGCECQSRPISCRTSVVVQWNLWRSSCDWPVRKRCCRSSLSGPSKDGRCACSVCLVHAYGTWPWLIHALHLYCWYNCWNEVFVEKKNNFSQEIKGNVCLMCWSLCLKQVDPCCAPCPKIQKCVCVWVCVLCLDRADTIQFYYLTVQSVMSVRLSLHSWKKWLRKCLKISKKTKHFALVLHNLAEYPRTYKTNDGRWV